MSEKHNRDLENTNKTVQNSAAENDCPPAATESESATIKDAHAAGVGAIGRNEDQIRFEKTPASEKSLEGGDQY